MKTFKEILEKIKILRIQKGISQTKMAGELGISQPGYANIEIGNTGNIPLNVAVGIAKVLDVSFVELFDIPLSLKDTEVEDTEIAELRKQINELNKKNEELRGRLTDKELLIKYFSKSNQNIRDYLVKKIADEYRDKDHELSKMQLPFDAENTPENLAKQNNVLEQMDLLTEKIKKEYREFIAYGILEQSDIDKYIQFYKSGKKEQL